MAESKTQTKPAFSAEERAAMKERSKEAKRAKDAAAGEAALRESIAGMDDGDRALAERFHAIVTTEAPDLAPTTWYGMPAWARGGKALCYFRPAAKFKERYATFGFNPNAALDDGDMWPISFAVTGLSEADERRIAELVRRAAAA